MNKDYAKKRRARFQKQKPSQRVFLMPSWAWMMSGLVLGVGLSGAVYWKTHKERTLIDSDVTIAMIDSKGKTKSKSLAKRVTTQTGEARFDFYNLLPNMAQESVEPIMTEATKPTTVALAKPTAPTTSAHPILDKALGSSKEVDPATYIIQAGSFRQLRQAEELKAKLAMAGFETSVQTFKQDNQEKWHRVYIGPFKDKELALASQQKLEQAQSLHSLIIKNRV